jgi:ADP-ribose pyrophosphatase YjhB (NUDIX family)
MQRETLYGSIIQADADISVGVVASGNTQTLQNLPTSSATTDPFLIAILSAVAGAIASEFIKWLLLKISALNMQSWEHTKADRMLVAISIIQSGKLILMTKRRAVPNSHLVWCFPSARVQCGEIITERIKTRFKEKYGVEVKPKKQVGEAYIAREDLKILYFYCEYDKGTAENLDNQENEDVKWVDVREVEKLVETRIYPSLIKLMSRIKEG